MGCGGGDDFRCQRRRCQRSSEDWSNQALEEGKAGGRCANWQSPSAQETDDSKGEEDLREGPEGAAVRVGFNSG